MESVTIGNNQAGQRLDKFLRKFLPGAGEGFLYKMLRKKNITLNGEKARGSEILAPEDKVFFFFSPETYEKMTGQPAGEKSFHGRDAVYGEGDMAGRAKAPAHDAEAAMAEYLRAYHRLSGSGISILYEDDNILAACKPAGVLSQKAKAENISLNEWLIGYLLEERGFPPEDLRTFKPSVCNRLDRNTSGIVLCGKSLGGSQYLSRHIRDRSIRKFYRTICAGEIKREITLRGYLKKDGGKNRVRVSRLAVEAPVNEGSTGESDYIETICRPLQISKGYTLVEAELITGKTHQIRAHLADAGHPLIGDYKYGDSRINRFFRERYGLEHQLLHAFRAELPGWAGDCVSGKKISDGAGDCGVKVICAPCPKIFTDILQGLCFAEEGKLPRG